MNNKILFGIVTATMLVLSPILMGLEEADAKSMKKMLREMEEDAECSERNLEKTLFYSQQNKIYQGNPYCDPDVQYKYDRLNQMVGIDEYKDRHNFVLEQNFDDDDDDNDKKKDKKKDRNDGNSMMELGEKMEDIFD